MITDEVIEKIEKLLALANSENENEALVAMSRVYKMLEKHKITMTEVVQADDIKNYISKMGGKTEEEMAWRYVQQLLKEYFFVGIARTKRKVVRDSKSFEDLFGDYYADCYAVFGDKHHVSLAGYACGLFMRSFLSSFDKYKRNNKWSASMRKQFFFGFFVGLEEQLDEARKKIDTIMASSPKSSSFGGFGSSGPGGSYGGSGENDPVPGEESIYTDGDKAANDLKKKRKIPNLSPEDLRALRSGYANAKTVKIIRPPVPRGERKTSMKRTKKKKASPKELGTTPRLKSKKQD